MGRFADTAHRVLSRKMQRDQMDQQAEDADANRALQYASMGQHELARGMNNQDQLRRVKELAASQQAQETIQANARMHGDNQQLEGIRVKSAAELEQERRKGLNQLAVEHTKGGYGITDRTMQNQRGQEHDANELAYKYADLDARKVMNTEDNNRARDNASTIANAASKDPEWQALMRMEGQIIEDIRNAASTGKTGQGAYGPEKDAKGRAMGDILGASAAQLIDVYTRMGLKRGVPYETARAQAAARAEQVLEPPASRGPASVQTKRFDTQGP